MIVKKLIKEHETGKLAILKTDKNVAIFKIKLNLSDFYFSVEDASGIPSFIRHQIGIETHSKKFSEMEEAEDFAQDCWDKFVKSLLEQTDDNYMPSL